MNLIKNISYKILKYLPNVIFILGMIGFIIFNVFAIYYLGRVLISDELEIDIGKGDMVNKYYRTFEWFLLTSIYVYSFVIMYRKLFKYNLYIYKRYFIIFICFLMALLYLLFPYLSLIIFNKLS